jgi:hypothetical protein
MNFYLRFVLYFIDFHDILVPGEEMFEWTTFAERTGGSLQFPLHYDLPPTRYAPTDKPWLYDFLLS